jgi:hypothetical protein
MRKPEFVVQVCLTPVERLSAEGRTVPVSVTTGVRPADPKLPDPPAARSAPRPARPGPGILRRNLPLLVILGVLAAINLAGLTYYVSTIGDRVRSPLHAWLKPSGYIGQSAGLIAFGLFVFLYLYPLRKRFPVQAFTGRLNRWLDVHIVAGLAAPLFGAVHAAWRFQGLIGWGYFSMVMVSLSGIVGKYLYTHIPRSKNGLALTLGQIEEKRAELLERIAVMTGLPLDEIAAVLAIRDTRSANGGVGAALSALLSSDFKRWRMMHRLRRKLRERNAGTRPLDKKTSREVVRLARREIAMTQQLRMLEATQRLFRFWHVFHRPFSITAFVAVTIHVALVVSLGVTWIW